MSTLAINGYAPSCLAPSSTFVSSPTTTRLLPPISSCNTMDSSDSPFSNLDVWCAWDGDTKVPVEVTVSVEVSALKTARDWGLTDYWHSQVRCTPNTQFHVLDTKSSSVVQIVEYTIHPKAARAEEIKSLADNADAVEGAPESTSMGKAPKRPTAQRIDTLGFGDTDTLPDAETPSTFSNSGSVIVRSDSAIECPGAGMDPFSHSLCGGGVWAAAMNSVPSPGAVIPRKRNSETASLPESVSDSERTYGGYKHRGRLLVDSQTVSSSSSLSGQSKRLSLIPRPVSAHTHARSEPVKIFVPPTSVSMHDTDCKRLDEASPVTPGTQNRFKELPFSNVSSPVTPGTSSPAGPTGKTRLLNLERLSKLSTVVSRGSPCDISALSSETGSSCSGVNDENSPPDGVAVVQQSASLLPGPGKSPRLVLVNGVFAIRCPMDTEAGAYEVSITLVLNLQKGRPRDWWELVLPGLPRLSSNDDGYVYFRTSSDQGIEVRTTFFKRHTLIDGCLMAQFAIPSRIVIPFRLCDAQFYGFLRDFTVTQAVRADVETPGEDEDCLVKYNAVCSIDLIQRDFSAKQCGFFIYIHGGPRGEFSCDLQQSGQRLPTIHLDADPEARIGVSEVQVICAPSSLALFVVAWEAKVPRKSACVWMPHVKASLDSGTAEVNLQAEFDEAQASNSYEVVRAEGTASKPVERAPGSTGVVHVSKPIERVQGSTPRKTIAWWKNLLKLCWSLWQLGITIWIFFLLANLYRGDRDDLRCAMTVNPGGSDRVESEVVDPATVPSTVRIETPVSMETDVPPMPLPTPLPLRDRIDYLLGWRGPM